MIKPFATMITILGLVMFIITFFVYLNSPAHIQYNNAVKYSMIDSGVTLSFFISSFLSITGITLLKISHVPRYV